MSYGCLFCGKDAYCKVFERLCVHCNDRLFGLGYALIPVEAFRAFLPENFGAFNWRTLVAEREQAKKEVPGEHRAGGEGTSQPLGKVIVLPVPADADESFAPAVFRALWLGGQAEAQAGMAYNVRTNGHLVQEAAKSYRLLGLDAMERPCGGEYVSRESTFANAGYNACLRDVAGGGK